MNNHHAYCEWEKNCPSNFETVKVSVLITLFLEQEDKVLEVELEVFSGEKDDMRALREAAKEHYVPRATEFEIELLIN